MESLISLFTDELGFRRESFRNILDWKITSVIYSLEFTGYFEKPTLKEREKTSIKHVVFIILTGLPVNPLSIGLINHGLRCIRLVLQFF